MRFSSTFRAERRSSASLTIVGILFFLMGTTIAAAGWASSRRRDLGEWVRHAHTILEQTERTRARLYEAQEAEESLERREEGQSVEEALGNARAEMDALDRLTSGAPAHRERVAALRLQWMRYETEIAARHVAPHELPSVLMPSAVSSRAFRLALRTLDSMREAEGRTLDARQAEWERAIRLSNLAIVASGGAMALALFALILLARREEAARSREREETRRRMDQLRDLSLRVPVAAIHISEGSFRMNDAAKRLVGYADEDVPTIDAWFRLTRGERAAEARRAYEAERAEGFRTAALRKIRRKDGAWLDVEFAGYADSTGEVWIFHDVTEALAARMGLEEANRALSELARTDALTGLANRRAFEEALTRLNQEGGTHAVIVLDIDRFKSVNDTFGHDAGDAALCQVATILSQTVGVHGLACRYGGEEFAVLMTSANTQAAAGLAERIRAAVEAGEFVHGATTVSAGVAVGSRAEDRFGWIGRADRALYVAKESGRNRVCIDGATDSVNRDFLERALSGVESGR